jgi:Holliday junction resolvase
VVRGAAGYERELRAILEGDPEALRRYSRCLPPERRPIVDRLRRHPFLVVRAAGSHGFDLVALRNGVAFPIEVKASGGPVIRFSDGSGRADDQLSDHVAAARRGGLVVVYAYRRLGERGADAWRLFTPNEANGIAGRVALVGNRLPRIERTPRGNGVLRWTHGEPLSGFLDTVFRLFDPAPGA